jgi:hypothetical protein
MKHPNRRLASRTATTTATATNFSFWWWWWCCAISNTRDICTAVAFVDVPGLPRLGPSTTTTPGGRVYAPTTRFMSSSTTKTTSSLDADSNDVTAKHRHNGTTADNDTVEEANEKDTTTTTKSSAETKALPMSSSKNNIPRHHPRMVYGHDDALFGCIERQQGNRPFGRMLDAGTGLHSLRWIATLVGSGNGKGLTSCIAVTADETMQRNCQKEVDALGVSDYVTVVIGNWFPPVTSGKKKNGINKNNNNNDDPLSI